MTAAADPGEAVAATIDARGMRCPWPALRLARAMAMHPAVTILADDPAAAGELAALAAARDWRLVRDGDAYRVGRDRAAR